MPDISRRLLKTAALSRTYLDRSARKEIGDFIRSKQTPDGGFCGRDNQSDLYYTVFAAVCLRILKQPVPLLKLWKYVRPFGTGESLDFVHLACLIQLRSIFPMRSKTRQNLLKNLEQHSAETAYDAFLKTLAIETFGQAGRLRYKGRRADGDTDCTADGSPAPAAKPTDPTSNLAAVVVLGVDLEPDILLSRACAGGGFCANPDLPVPDLLSTAVALFALRTQNVSFDEIREPCLEFVESLWRESGGFSGHTADGFEDVEYTFYGLLSIGCLLE